MTPCSGVDGLERRVDAPDHRVGRVGLSWWGGRGGERFQGVRSSAGFPLLRGPQHARADALETEAAE